MNPLSLWQESEFKKLIVRGYQRDGTFILPCPDCSRDVIEQPILEDSIERKARCTNCGIVYREQLVEVDETEIRVRSLPFECELENIKSSSEKLLIFIAYLERYWEASE